MVLILSILGDVIGDIVLYYIGFFMKKGFLPKNRKFLKSGGSSESKGYLNKILKLRDGKLDPTYFILIANKKWK